MGNMNNFTRVFVFPPIFTDATLQESQETFGVMKILGNTEEIDKYVTDEEDTESRRMYIKEAPWELSCMYLSQGLVWSRSAGMYEEAIFLIDDEQESWNLELPQLTNSTVLRSLRRVGDT